MSQHFADDRMCIEPLVHEPGIKLYGRIVGAHKIPLNLALQSCRGQYKDVTVDLTCVDYLAQSVLETLVAAARTLPPPGHLTLRTHPELNLPGRLTAHGWQETQSLQLAEA
ncbi:hypothetical protein [Streptomyces tauricus]|uniref:hypothetical protein n=1 Tax=Streptomyces tauricus TaxID=68274 RepID=UPI00224485DE|nr:hypothetical protein [Streptomyces tauricus]MCW8103235.1 hypothetical protein [Streptomyces tauricus]